MSVVSGPKSSSRSSGQSAPSAIELSLSGASAGSRRSPLVEEAVEPQASVPSQRSSLRSTRGSLESAMVALRSYLVEETGAGPGPGPGSESPVPPKRWHSSMRFLVVTCTVIANNVLRCYCIYLFAKHEKYAAVAWQGFFELFGAFLSVRITARDADVQRFSCRCSLLGRLLFGLFAFLVLGLCQVIHVKRAWARQLTNAEVLQSLDDQDFMWTAPALGAERGLPVAIVTNAPFLPCTIYAFLTRSCYRLYLWTTVPADYHSYIWWCELKSTMDTIILGLAVVSALTVLSINVVDIDLAVSVFVARRYHFDLRVRGSRVGYLQVFYPAAHIIFRIAEVLWRISMLVAFAAVTAFQLGVLGVLLTALVCTAEYLCMLIILKRHSPKDEACGVHFIVAAFLVVADVTRFVDRPGFCYPARRISRAVDRWRKVQFLLLAGFVTCLRLSIPPSRKTFVERVHALTLMIVLLSSLTVSELLKLTPMIKSVGDDLHTAVLHHKISRVRKLLDTSLGGEALDVNGPTKDSEKITAAMLAAENGFVEALRMIMACGGKVEVRSAQKETCLHYAVRAKQLEALELLVNQPGAQQLLRQVHGELRSCATKALGLTEDPGQVFSSSEAQRLFLLLEPNRGTRRRVEENSSTVSLQNVRTHLAVSRTLLKFFPNAVEEDVPELHELHSVSALVLAHAAGPLGRFLLPQAAVASLKSMRKVRALGQGSSGTVIEVEIVAPVPCSFAPATFAPTVRRFSSDADLTRSDSRHFAMKLQAKRKMHLDWQAYSEVVALRRCGHPFIVRLEQAFQTPHYYALLLELCPNGDLNQLLCSTQDETGRCAGLPVARAAKYAGQVLLALVHIHEALGIIYRDVKPENMLLSASDEAKLADFGLALYVGSKAFSAHCIPIAGTPRFLAPELVMGEEEDEGDPPGVPDVRFDPFKTDAYSFGVTLQVMLLGEDCADLEEGDGCLWILPRRLPDQEQAQLLHNACEGSRLMPEAVDLLLKLLPSKPRFRSRLADKRIKKHPFFLTALGCQDLEERLLKAQ